MGSNLHIYMYVWVLLCVCVCVCVCVCNLIPVSNLYGYTDKFGVLVTLEPCNVETRGKLNTDQWGLLVTLYSCHEEALGSNIFLNTNNNELQFSWHSAVLPLKWHFISIRLVPLYYKIFQQHHLPVIILSTHVYKNVVSSLKYTRKNTSRHSN